MRFTSQLTIAWCIFTAPLGTIARVPPRDNSTRCHKTSVAILGAGVAGITAAQALSNASVSDFLIIERNDYIGGRVAHTNFGKKPDGTSYVVELGANWIQGLGAPGAPQNPIWTLVEKYGINNTYSDYDSIKLYDESGEANYSTLFDAWDDANQDIAEHAGYTLENNLQDVSARTALNLAGWKPKKDMHAQAIEWWSWDWESALSPDENSLVFGVTNYNATFNQFGEDNNFAWDQRGFNRYIIGEADEFLEEHDPRLFLGTIVKKISYSPSGIVVYLDDGGCVEAQHAISTFSVGVLQNDVVEFDPPLPRWKREAIEQFGMATYTKIFFQFNETFWDRDTQYFLYADNITRGYYPVWQSLSAPGFLEESNIIFVTVIGDQSYRVERQSNEKTKAEAMEVLGKMFPDKHIPDPIAFMYPRWSTEEWAYGSYSSWPVGMTLEKHQNLRANVNRLWFAGEATSAEYYGFMHASWFTGRDVGIRVAGQLGKGPCAGNASTSCGSMVEYSELHGTTPPWQYNVANGWPVSSFVTTGIEDE
ncbi:putative flavin-containing polyamine oxidase [Hypoxylon trugodes]|uniref:putative flavin-containing polyamine oxidase n=1 Tax=Hypoxylon trugodes TaxID=326681 RepID=UPI002194ADE8|nr:putative flavin-containing polyamine oxidase [Hypoxylon trugodes]KAI1393355.1 putative flavin-containing polyamine oxidase [Hypoxylon trugodes]